MGEGGAQRRKHSAGCTIPTEAMNDLSSSVAAQRRVHAARPHTRRSHFASMSAAQEQARSIAIVPSQLLFPPSEPSRRTSGPLAICADEVPFRVEF
jgi:hypothetical protein